MEEMKILQYGKVTGGDFMENEITIVMDSQDFVISFQDVAIVKITSLSEKIALEEFINNQFK